MKFEKFEEIASNYFNGNLTDFKNQLRKLTKLELVAFIEMCEEHACNLVKWSVYNFFRKEGG